MMKSKKGFTLLELLIVVGIIAILSVALILILDPAETLRKSRDAQRMSDLATLKTVIGLYITSTSSPSLGTLATCKTSGGSWASGNKIYYSVPTSGPTITDTTFDGQSAGVVTSNQVSSSNLTLTDATGWIPINFNSLVGGSPISNLPLDPVNTISDAATIASSTLVYRYVCNTATKFEIDSSLESTTYTVADNRLTKDGGNNSNYLEVGTDLSILGTGGDF